MQRVLMPTDGSPESEKPLALVSQLARAVLGHPAAALLDYESHCKSDLVVMATHGRTDLLRFAWEV